LAAIKRLRSSGHEPVHGGAGTAPILIAATAARQARKSFLRFNLSTMFRLRVIVIVAPLALPPFDLSRRYRITHEDDAAWARCPAP
jgi:hypothetical protein